MHMHPPVRRKPLYACIIHEAGLIYINSIADCPSSPSRIKNIVIILPQVNYCTTLW